MNRYKSILLVVISSVIAAAIILLWTVTFNKDGFIDNNRLFLEFAGTKELIKKAEGNMSDLHRHLDTLNARLVILDSLVTKNKQTDLVRELSETRYVRDSLHYIYKEQTNQYMSEIQEQSWNLLNQYIIDFGEEKRYKYIFGANGSGTMMYGVDSKDITDKLLEYVNNKYNEK